MNKKGLIIIIAIVIVIVLGWVIVPQNSEPDNIELNNNEIEVSKDINEQEIIQNEL